MREGQWEKVPGHRGVRRMRSPNTRSGFRYQAMWRDAGGAQRARQFDNLKAATEHLASVVIDRKTGALADLSKGEQTIIEVLAKYQEEFGPYSDSQLRLDGQSIRNIGAIRNSRLRDITRPDVVRALAAIEAPSSKKESRKFLSKLFTYAIGEGWITVSPLPVTKRARTRHARVTTRQIVKPPKFLDAETFDRVLAATPDPWKAAVLLGGRMGLRPGEVFALTVGKFIPAQEIPFATRAQIVVSSSISAERMTKTGLTRTLPLPGYIADALVTHIQAHTDGQPDSPLFTNESGNPIDDKNAFDAWRRRHWSKVVAAAKLDTSFTPNDLRHSAASFAIGNGANVYNVQAMLGHARASITLDIYGELFPKSMDDLVDRMDAALRKTA